MRWNVNGWTESGDNPAVRDLCVQNISCDFSAFNETHLLKDAVLKVNGFKWLGNNRKIIRVKAHKGSGDCS